MASSTCSSASAADSTYSIPNQQPPVPTSTPTIEHQVPSFKDLNKSTHPSDFKASKKAPSSSTNSNTSISHANNNNNIKNVMNKKFSASSIDLKARIEKCLQAYTKKKRNSLSTPTSRTSPTDTNSNSDNSDSNEAGSVKDSCDEAGFIESLFTELLQSKYADKSITDNLTRIHSELRQTHVIRNTFLVIAKLGHEFFKLNMLNISECLLEFSINKVETNSLRLKMATLSTLSACYWRQAKFIESINCMDLELQLAAYLNTTKSENGNDQNEVYLTNIYRIYGNLASAYQRLNRYEECLANFRQQLEVSLQMKDNVLVINANNSIGLAYNKTKDYARSLEHFERSLELINAAEDESNGLASKKLKMSQFNLIGESCLKLAMYEKARENFMKQLQISYELSERQEKTDMASQKSDMGTRSVIIENLNQHNMQECLALFSLALISSKLKNIPESIEFYEACLNRLQTHFDAYYTQQTLEIYGRLFIGLVNNYLSVKDNIKASLYAHTMLDFTLKEIAKMSSRETSESSDETSGCADKGETKALDKSFNSQNRMEEDEREESQKAKRKRMQYLKFIEMTACSKLATCYLRQNRLVDAFKLHQREATLALQLNNTLYLTRAYSHMAQIYFHSKDYEKCIFLYKQILHTIEMSLMDEGSSSSGPSISDSVVGDAISEDEMRGHEDEEMNTDFEYDLQKRGSRSSGSGNERYGCIRDERLVQMIYFTLSNIGLCMEMLKRFDDSRLMFYEQFEISKLIKNSKFKANALLNLVNLYLNKTKIDSNYSMLELASRPNSRLRSAQQANSPEHIELVHMLRQLFDIYQELNDVNGKLFTSQCLAYCYHTMCNLKQAIKFYKFNMKLARMAGNVNEMLNKSIFNLSLCYKMQSRYEDAYKLQMEYLEQTEKQENNEFAKFTSLGLIADFLFEMNRNEESCQRCIQIHIDRLKIIKTIDIRPDGAAVGSDSKQTEDSRSSAAQLRRAMTDENKCKLISECLESISKIYYEMENYQQVLKFKLLQVELLNELEQDQVESGKDVGDAAAGSKSVCKLKIWLDIGNLFLFKFEDANEAYKYYEMVLQLAQNIKDLLLQSLVLGNMGLCKQKMGEYDESLEFFKEQLIVLDRKLKTIDEKSILNNIHKPASSEGQLRKSDSLSSSSTAFSHKLETPTDSLNKQLSLRPTAANIHQIKEIISIRIDMGRAYSKLGKCNELLSHHKVESQFYLNEALRYFNEYCCECEFLFENYVKSYFYDLKNNKLMSKQQRKLSDDADSIKLDQESETDEPNEEGGLDIHELMKDLCEQIYIDFDASFAKLAHFYTVLDTKNNSINVNNIERAIDINEKRLSLLSFTRPILSRPVWANFNIQINYLLASLYAKQLNTLVKSTVFCENIIQLYTEESLFDGSQPATPTTTELDSKPAATSSARNHKLSYLKDNIYLIETLNLLCDISLIIKPESLSYDLLLDKALKAYKMIWQSTKTNSIKVLKLKFDSICRLCCIYRQLKMPKECLEILMEGSNRFTYEFQRVQQQQEEEIQQQQNQSDTETQEKSSASDSSVNESMERSRMSLEQNIYVIQYIEYLFLIHRKIALIHIRHAIESNLIAQSKDLVEKSFFLALKYVNEALTYLNYQKEFQIGQIIECRQASIYFLLGKCHKFLKNTEMELEMFANALDLYETIVPQSSYSSDTFIKDRISLVQSAGKTGVYSAPCAELFDSIKNDDDEETVVNYIERVDQLYQYIEDALIKMDKLKEALLVTERHKAKKSASLLSLPELLTFEQIEKLVDTEHLHALVYFSRVEVSSRINCWLILPSRGIARFHQVSFKVFDKIFNIAKKSKGAAQSHLVGSMQEIQRYGEQEQNLLLKAVYECLIQPFEETLFENLLYVNEQYQTRHLTKPSLFIAYDEDMFKVPFHLLRCPKLQNRYLFEVFEMDCAFSLKFLFKGVNYSQKFVKHNQQDGINSQKSNMPMRVISNEKDMEKLLTTQVKPNSYLYDLLLLLVDSENKDIKALNSLVNTLLSQKLSKAVILEFNYTGSDTSEKDAQKELAKSEANSNQFLTKLYSRLSNRTSLKSSLILSTIQAEGSNNNNNKSQQQKLLNYLIFGHLSKSEGHLFPKPEVPPKPDIQQTPPQQQQSQPKELNQTPKSPSPVASVAPEIPPRPSTSDKHQQQQQPLRREKSLENMLMELSQESEEVTFSQVIVQFLKLNAKFEQTSIILNIVITILDDYLSNRLVRDSGDPTTVTLKNLFVSFSATALQNNQLVASRLMLKKLGFHFYIDAQARYLTRLPGKNLHKKLRLIYRCLLIFKTFPPKLLQGLFDRTKTKAGKDLLSLLQKFQSNSKLNNTTVFNLSMSSYKKHEEFLVEFAQLTHFVDYVKVEAKSEILNSIILIATIILNDDMKSEAEKTLQNYIEVFFKNMDGSDPAVEQHKIEYGLKGDSLDQKLSEDEEEDDLTSQYSTLSSMLGFQPPEKISSKRRPSKQHIMKEYEIKIEREASEPKISQHDIEKAKQTASKLQKMIEINVSPDLHNAEYDEYLNELVHRNQSKNPYHLHRPQHQPTYEHASAEGRSTRNQRESRSNCFSFDAEDEFKCKSLVHLEENECLDQFVTTTTTVRTTSKDDLFMLFDNNFFGNENHSEDQLNEFFNEQKSRQSQRAKTDNNQPTSKSKININKNVYSCLNNYFSNAEGKKFTTV